MEITKEHLEKYRSKKQEIRELIYELNHLGEGDTMIGNDVIFDYQTGYGRPQTVVGFDMAKYERMKARKEKRKKKLEQECEEIELFVDGIEDSMMRIIFQQYFINGVARVTQEDVAKRIHMDRSRVSRRIDEYLKDAHKAQEAHV